MGLSWYVNRLRAMGPAEVAWRVRQRALERRERREFGREKRRADEPLCPEASLRADWSRLPLNLAHREEAPAREIELLGGYAYANYRTRWHAGFQTGADWPLEPSYGLAYKGRDDVGDARTNWELNRGLQFALLAKGAYATGDGSYVDELEGLLESWCESNPFLWGISWTSAMEVAIRCVNWMYAAAFLAARGGGRAEALSRRLEAGAANMAAYVAAHHSRYSSSNNHAIVEASALGLAGLAFGCEEWRRMAREVLTAEVPRQTHPDGVNREQCLHYQAFFMEAVGLYLLALRKVGEPAPEGWAPGLARMCDYVQDCRVAAGAWLEFGDDDEGCILNLDGPKPDACAHALLLVGAAMDADVRWGDYAKASETLRWLLPAGALAAAQARPLRGNGGSATYPDGGVTIMRSTDGRVVLGMDHGPLGFGSIAAHGHADALSVQLYVDGHCIVGDPGTYLYHCDRAHRDGLRSTRGHSTVCVDGRDQSEMLGTFMWGRRAECSLLSAGPTLGNGYAVEASHDGHAPATHARRVEFDGASRFVVTDRVEGANAPAEVAYILPPAVEASIEGAVATLVADGASVARITFPVAPKTEPMPYSPCYGVLAEGTRLSAPLALGENATILEVIA